MKRIRTTLFDALRTTSTQMVLGWRVIRRDGYTLGFTTSDTPFTYQGLDYEPSNAFSGMAVSSKSNFSVDNTNAAVLISDSITERDLQAGLWDSAQVELFWIDPLTPELGCVPIRGGMIGEVKIKNGTFEAELRSPFQKLQQPFGKFYMLECRTTFGDAECKVLLDCDAWQRNARYIAKAGADAGIGSYVKPRVQNGFWYQCITAQGSQVEITSTPSIIPMIDAYSLNTARASYPELAGLSDTSAYAKIAAVAQEIRLGTLIVSDSSSPFEKWVQSLVNQTTGSFVSQEGESPLGQSYYLQQDVSQGTLENSNAFLTPTDMWTLPASAPAGVEPLAVTNISSTIVYALGLSGASEPVWPQVIGQTITDNQLVWRCIRARRLRGSVSAVFSRSHFLDATRAEPLGYWKYGAVQWLSGDNTGLKTEVRDYAQVSGGSFALLEAMPGEIKVGDEYEVWLGCAKTRTACKSVDNLNNYRGFPDMPTEEKALATANLTEHGAPKNTGGS